MTSRPALVGVAALLLAAVAPALAQNVPSGAKYTILLQSYYDQDHIARSKQALELFRGATGLGDFQLVHSDGQSVLYYGYYKAIDRSVNEDEALRYHNDLNRLMGVMVDGELPFRGAYGTILPMPTPKAPAEWDLANATGKYSLEVAMFKVSPTWEGNPKQAAVDLVKKYRDRNVPAYYYHTNSASHVLVGSFPATAVTVMGDEVKANRNDAGITVVPFKPAGMDEVQEADGRTSKVVAPSVKINDPELLALLKVEEFQQHAVNDVVGHRVTDPRTGKTRDVIDHSIIIDISKLRDDASASHVKREPAPSPNIIIPQPSTPGGGLRKVGG